MADAHGSWMRRTLLALVALLSFTAALGSTLSCAPTTYVVAPDPPAPPPAPLDPFFDELGPYGDWWWNDTWGWVWSPSVGLGWRPYTVGHWVWTQDWGWLWVSNEPFGWACFHYGRWVWLDDAGWVWVPGRVWGPGWVMWRTGPGYIGWVPMGPGPYVDAHMHVWWWVFVEERHFLAPDIVVVAAPPHRNPAVLPSTQVIHRPERSDDQAPPNREVEVSTVERAAGVKLIPRRVLEAQEAGAELPDAIAVRRAPSVEADRDEAPRDLFSPKKALARDRVLEDRPLGAPDDDAAERHFREARERLQAEHEVERKAPPKGLSPDQLRARQQDEQRTLEEQAEREKEAAKKKKAVKRPALPKKVKKP